jgi:16S rRNA (adenine(1408)-N(1))-methyltransferase
MAVQHPDELVIGVDAVAENLRAQARRLAAKPARGGLPNALLGRLVLADAPGALEGLADRLTVVLPWGALLAAVARPEVDGLTALRAICRQGAAIRFVFGYGSEADGTRVKELALPAIDDDAGLAALSARYRATGFAVRARAVSVADIRALPTTWAKRLAFSGRPRPFVEVSGRAV